MLHYRPDIDGLRAVAVVAVVLFHAGVPGAAGGYVGVDVFFVISGYLITSLILAQQAKGQFTLLWFYERRIRRIFPALFIVILACAAAGWFVMAPNDYKRLGQSIFATSLFLSNIFFWLQEGYFHPFAQIQPLLHTWSLAVEEQYYLGFPLLMMLVTKIGKKTLTQTIIVLTGASFIACSILVFFSPMSAFYLFPFRAWELLLGSCLAIGLVPFQHQLKYRNYLSTFGLGLIIVPVLFYSKETLFPGISALLPTCGSALFIWCGAEALPITNRLIASRPFVFVGKISYSLYLWHFVVLAFGSYLTIGKMGPNVIALLLAISFALATLSWLVIEQPVRKTTLPLFRGRALLGGACLTMTCLVLIGWIIPANNGFPTRVSVDQRSVSAMVSGHLEDRDCFMSLIRAKSRQFCKMGTPNSFEPTFFIWGDSHGITLRSVLDATAKKQDAVGWLAVSAGCPPLIGIDGDRYAIDCANINQNILEYIASEKSIRDVILIGRWAYYSKKLLPLAFGQTLSALVAARKHIWIVGPVPEVLVGPTPGVEIDIPRALYLKSWGIGRDTRIEPTRAEFDRRESDVIATLEAMAEKYPVHVVWPHAALCNSKSCTVEMSGKPFYVDTNHLSSLGANYIEQILEPIKLK
jgi:peptidoglycan/LPS O-acetylase OafA/YrhL